MNEAMEPIDPIHSAMMLGMTPKPCEPTIEITRQAVTKLLDVVEFGDQLERVEKDRLVAFVKDLLAEDQPELWATYIPGPGEIHPCLTKEHAERDAKATLEVCEKMKADRIARGQSVEFWPEIVAEVIPSPFTPLEHFELLAKETIQDRDDLVEYAGELKNKLKENPDPAWRALIRHAMNMLNLRNHVPGSDVDLCVKALDDLLEGKHSPAPEPSEAWRTVAEIAQAETPAVVNQQVTTAACLWKREQDSGFYETGCGQTWHFTDGSTPEENSAYFCHHCGKSLEVQRLIAYQVGDNDIVAAYDPAGAIEVLCTFNGYELDEFTVDEVVAVSDALLDSTEAFDQDEGKTVPLEKTLRQELEELTEPAYLHGWE